MVFTDTFPRNNVPAAMDNSGIHEITMEFEFDPENGQRSAECLIDGINLDVCDERCSGAKRSSVYRQPLAFTATYERRKRQ